LPKKYLIPENLLYTSTHEWIKVVDSIGTVGITDYAQDQLHDIVYIELPEINIHVKKGDVVLEIESVKAVAEVYSPVSGKIIGVNEILNDTPEIVNKSPYEEGWLFKISIDDKNELIGLLTPKKYASLIKE
jgi:glycine cleavage system H protein